VVELNYEWVFYNGWDYMDPDGLQTLRLINLETGRPVGDGITDDFGTTLEPVFVPRPNEVAERNALVVTACTMLFVPSPEDIILSAWVLKHVGSRSVQLCKCLFRPSQNQHRR
jgi:hypothetical protein